jgi:hypothetical protein
MRSLHPLLLGKRSRLPWQAGMPALQCLLERANSFDCQHARGASPCGDMGDQPRIKIESVTQLAVFLSNRPGALARVCEELAGAEINIHALSISDTADHSVVRMAVSDPTKALMLLGERGVLALETEVLMIETENHPGVLGQLAHRLADAEINIEYAYMAATLNSTKGLMILRPDDVEKAQQVLHDL